VQVQAHAWSLEHGGKRARAAPAPAPRPAHAQAQPSAQAPRTQVLGTASSPAHRARGCDQICAQWQHYIWPWHIYNIYERWLSLAIKFKALHSTALAPRPAPPQAPLTQLIGPATPRQRIGPGVACGQICAQWQNYIYEVWLSLAIKIKALHSTALEPLSRALTQSLKKLFLEASEVWLLNN
jgi:hypothetical protein